jgi:putative transposase
MAYNPTGHHRRTIRLKGFDYSQEGAYFVTIVTHNRECLFGNIENGQLRSNLAGQ